MLYGTMRAVLRYALSIYFRSVEAEHSERVASRGPVLIVANHVNAFVDALVVIVTLARPVTLTAKSTLRRNPLLRMLMDLFGVVEVHRRQDRDKGADPEKNVEQLQKVRKRLEEGGLVCIFPEGVSHSQPHLQPFRTGAARIALDYTDHNRDEPLLIVPVGIHYEAKERLRSGIWLRFGEPIEVTGSLAELSAEELTRRIEEKVRELTLNHERRREALLVDWAAEVMISAGVMPPMAGRDDERWPEKVRRMDALQSGLESVAGEDPEAVASMVERLRAYRRRLRLLGIGPREVSISMNPLRALFFVVREIELIVFGLPIVALGSLQHFLPWVAVRAYTHRSSSDPDHWASNALFAGLFLWPPLLVLEAFVLGLATSWWWAAAFLLAAPFTLRFVSLFLEHSGRIGRRAAAFLRFALMPRLRTSLEVEAIRIADDIDELAAKAGVEVR